jgi:hypothetical protein
VAFFYFFILRAWMGDQFLGEYRRTQRTAILQAKATLYCCAHRRLQILVLLSVRFETSPPCKPVMLSFRVPFSNTHTVALLSRAESAASVDISCAAMPMLFHFLLSTP